VSPCKVGHTEAGTGDPRRAEQYPVVYAGACRHRANLRQAAAERRAPPIPGASGSAFKRRLSDERIS